MNRTLEVLTRRLERRDKKIAKLERQLRQKDKQIEQLRAALEFGR